MLQHSQLKRRFMGTLGSHLSAPTISTSGPLIALSTPVSCMSSQYGARLWRSPLSLLVTPLKFTRQVENVSAP